MLFFFGDGYLKSRVKEVSEQMIHKIYKSQWRQH